MNNHVLFQTGDVDYPIAIKDQNGGVVLNMCKICHEAEAELTSPCIDS